METIKTRFSIGISIFYFSMLLSIFSFILPKSELLVWGALVITIVYLALGWLIFKGYYPEGSPILLFLMGYLYSGVFIGILFYLTDWPLAKTMITVTPLWITLQLLIIYSLRKKVIKKVLAQFIVESIILLSLAIGLIIQVS